MDKYYTPKLEEFHVGFEFEAQNILDRQEWINKVIIYGKDISYKEIAIKHKEVRVKYLDKDDIEDLGFTKIRPISSEKVSKVEAFAKDNLILVFNYEKHIVSAFTRDPSMDKCYMLSNNDPNQIGGLIINNKTELKKLLKQNKK